MFEEDMNPMLLRAMEQIYPQIFPFDDQYR
jgi:hypothetical protein